jgi:hypothetical protein
MTKSDLIQILEDVPDDYEVGINDGGLFKDINLKVDEPNKLLVIEVVDNWI